MRLWRKVSASKESCAFGDCCIVFGEADHSLHDDWQRVCSIMLLTVSKRVEFSASRRLFSTIGARRKPGRLRSESSARYGTGRNYVAYFVFTGQLDPITGMLINISEIKERAGEFFAMVSIISF